MSRGSGRRGARRPSGAVLRLALALAATLSIGALAIRAESGNLFYFVEDNRIVFTNTPSRADARAVPGVEAPQGVHSTIPLPATPYDPYIVQVARQTGLAPDLIKAVALVESAMDPVAVSPKGARGLMQLMPGTAAQYGVRDVFDPGENLLAGARHLRKLLDDFDGDLTLALAAYNAGSGAVRRYGGVPAYRETRDYVRRVHQKLGRKAPGVPEVGATAANRAEPVRMLRRGDGTILLVN